AAGRGLHVFHEAYVGVFVIDGVAQLVVEPPLAAELDSRAIHSVEQGHDDAIGKLTPDLDHVEGDALDERRRATLGGAPSAQERSPEPVQLIVLELPYVQAGGELGPRHPGPAVEADPQLTHAGAAGCGGGEGAGPGISEPGLAVPGPGQRVAAEVRWPRRPGFPAIDRQEPDERRLT